jgi:hypothetical protein
LHVARIRLVDLVAAKWGIECGEHAYEIGVVGRGLAQLFSQRFQLSGPGISIIIPPPGFSEDAVLPDGRRLWFATTQSIAEPTSLLTMYTGRVGIGAETFSWRVAKSKAALELQDHRGNLVALAIKPWQDSEAGVQWLIEWRTEVEDEFTRLAIMLAPWAASMISMPQSGDL